jgi:hypothetical protein
MIQCMSCKKSCHENCAGEPKRHYFGSTAREVVTLICPFLHHCRMLPSYDYAGEMAFHYKVYICVSL